MIANTTSDMIPIICIWMRILSVLARVDISCSKTFGRRFGWFWMSDNPNDQADVSKPNPSQRPIYARFHTRQIIKMLFFWMSNSHPACRSAWWEGSKHRRGSIMGCYLTVSKRIGFPKLRFVHSRCRLCLLRQCWVQIKLLLTYEWLSGVKAVTWSRVGHVQLSTLVLWRQFHLNSC